MEYLHQQDIVHRDLRTPTILLNSHNNPHVGNFSVSPGRRSTAALALRTTLRRRFFGANCTTQRSASIPTELCFGRC
jgi:serine/threonine protein kinase